MKFETPEEFAESVTQIVEYNVKHKYRPRTGVVQSVVAKIASRDAALTAKVREECAEKLRAFSISKLTKNGWKVKDSDTEAIDELCAAIVGKEGEE